MAGHRFRALLAAALAGALACAGGCGKPPAFTDTVEGTLTLDGAPLSAAHVEFVPEVPDGTKAPNSSAVTDANGFFRLTRNDNQKPGAVIGPHRVIIFPGRPAANRDDTGGQAQAADVPPVYMNAAKTPLKVEITADQKKYDLRLNRAGTATP
jgi:hypothetical protein